MPSTIVRAVVLLSLGVVCFLAMGAVAPAHAQAPVTQPIILILYNIGPPSGTAVPPSLSLSGCDVSVGSITSSTSITADPNCTIRATLPVDGTHPTWRYISPSGASIFAIDTCSTGTCGAYLVGLYFQVQNNYTAIPAAPVHRPGGATGTPTPGDWDAPLKINVIGSYLGFNNYLICGMSTVAGAVNATCAPGTGSHGWSDYDETTYPQPSTLTAPGMQWKPVVPYFYANENGQTVTVDYYEQVKENFSYTPVSTSLSALVPPTLNYSSFGLWTTAKLNTSAMPIWVDFSSAWSVVPNLGVPTGAGRWLNDPAQGSGIATPGALVDLLYYHQISLLLGYSTEGGAALTPPSVACNYFGKPDTFAVSAKPAPIWCDDDSPWSVPTLLQGSNGNERWYLPGKSSGTLTAHIDENLSYFTQYHVSFAYTVTGGGTSYSPPTVSFGYLGHRNTTLVTAPVSVWVDAGSNWTAPQLLSSSGTAGERWSTATPSEVVGGARPFVIPYYHQFAVTVAYTVTGGATLPAAATLNYLSYGSNTSATFAPSTATWMDGGGYFWLSAAAPSGNERWGSSPALVSGARTVTVTLYHQYALRLLYSLTGGGTGYTPPALTYTSFGSSEVGTLTGASNVYWADSGTPWSVPNQLQGSTPQERWALNQTSFETTSSPVKLALRYYHQYLVSLDYNIAQGGSGPAPPSVSFSQFGSTLSATKGWADAGSVYSFSNPLSGSSATERWYSPNATGTISSSGTVGATYYHQYLLTLSYSVALGGTAAAPKGNLTSLGSASTQALSPSPTTYWVDAGSKWSVSGVLPGSGASVRWATKEAASGSASSAATMVFTYYQQFPASMSYSLTGGGAPSAPVMDYTGFGSSATATLSTQTTQVWIDSGAKWSLPALLPGSTRQERWITNASIAGTMGAAFRENLAYDHQFRLEVSSNNVNGGTFSNVTKWYSPGAKVGLSASAASGWEFAYWKGGVTGAYNGTSPAQAVPLLAPANETAVFYPGLTITSGIGGTVTYAYGSTTGTIPSGQQRIIYLPPQTVVSLSASAKSSYLAFQGWSGAVTTNGKQASLAVGVPFEVYATFGLNYMLVAIGAAAVLGVVVVVAAVKSGKLSIHRKSAKAPEVAVEATAGTVK